MRHASWILKCACLSLKTLRRTPLDILASNYAILKNVSAKMNSLSFHVLMSSFIRLLKCRQLSISCSWSLWYTYFLVSRTCSSGFIDASFLEYSLSWMASMSSAMTLAEGTGGGGSMCKSDLVAPLLYFSPLDLTHPSNGQTHLGSTCLGSSLLSWESLLFYGMWLLPSWESPIPSSQDGFIFYLGVILLVIIIFSVHMTVC